MFAQSTRALAALALLLAATTSAHAIQFLQPGPQSLEGVMVMEPMAFGGAPPVPGQPRPKPPVLRYGLLLSPGSRSEQFIPIEAPMGNRLVYSWLSEVAVPRRLPAGSDRYEGVPRYSLSGNLAGSMGKGFTFYVAEVPDNSPPDPVEATQDAWRQLARNLQHPFQAQQAAQALETLESLGLLKRMARAALAIDR